MSLRARYERWFTGLTWKGFALIALLALLNALRRTSWDFFDLRFDLWLAQLVESFATGLIALLPIMLAVVATYNRVPSRPRARYPAIAAAVALSSVVGVTLLGLVEAHGDPDNFESAWWYIVGTWPRYALVGALIAAVFVSFRVAEESEAATHQAELDRTRLDQQMNEARLQVLQAQIEPHFLFNTLATVRRLYQMQPAGAEAMLENVMRYLAVALPQMRAAHSTLGRETALAESYLAIQQIRMGRRLGYAVEVPAELREARLPPMMLLTLAENAIKHGLSPLPEGGFIRVTAQVDSGQLQLQVADSGQGFSQTSGGGTGLANIRARLAAMYGPAAHLSIAVNRPRGVTATIGLPYSTVGPLAVAP